MGFLSDEDRARLKPSELLAYETPIPTQVVSSDEYYPYPQTEKQRELQARLLALADDLAAKQGLSRRRFFQNGGVLRGHERNLRSFLRRDARGGGDPGYGR
jgi:hypothetical protein